MRHVPQGDVNRTQTLASPPRGVQLIFALDAIFPQPNLPGVGGFATQIHM